MPTLIIHTNVAVADKNALLSRCSAETADMLGKPESYVMVELADSRPMLFAGSSAPTAFIELKSLGLSSSQSAGLSNRICNLLSEQLGINPERIYIEFAAPERAMFGWNGGTF